MSLSAKIIIGLILGVAVGLFFGEQVEFLRYAADAFILLLQMSVLPYIVVSLVAGLGSNSRRCTADTLGLSCAENYVFLFNHAGSGTGVG